MDLTLADFVVYLLWGSAAAVLLCSLFSKLSRARAERRALAHRVTCRLCLHSFQDYSHQRVVTCPICGAANEKGRSRRLG